MTTNEQFLYKKQREKLMEQRKELIKKINETEPRSKNVFSNSFIDINGKHIGSSERYRRSLNNLKCPIRCEIKLEKN